MSKMKKLSIISALFVIFCSGGYYLLASERLWFECSNCDIRYGGDDAYDSHIYQSFNGRLYVYLIEKNSRQTIFLIDKTNQKIGCANDYLNKLSMFGITIDSYPILYDISSSNEKTGFDPKLNIQPNVINFYRTPEDITANKRVVIQFYDN